MDAHDLFRQLTRGVRFTKRNKPQQKVISIKISKTKPIITTTNFMSFRHNNL